MNVDGNCVHGNGSHSKWQRLRHEMGAATYPAQLLKRQQHNHHHHQLLKSLNQVGLIQPLSKCHQHFTRLFIRLRTHSLLNYILRFNVGDQRTRLTIEIIISQDDIVNPLKTKIIHDET